MQDYDLDERDLRLLHALQLRPRAPWAALAPVVGADAVTLARRWNALQESGLAWITSYRGPGAKYTGAIVEIACAPSSVASVTEDLARDDEVLTIDQTAGGRDLVVTLLCSTDTDLGRFVLDRLPAVSGITSTRTHRGIRLLADAQRWRLRSLPEREIQQLEMSLPHAAAPQRGVSAAVEQGVVDILRIDARASLSRISEELGVSPSIAKNALATVMAGKRLVLRLEVARTYSPWPVAVWYFLRVPATEVEHVAAKLVGLEEMRLVATTGGLYSILMNVWLRRVEDMTVLERQLGERLPFAEIMDRSLVLRTPKHMGQRLTPDGRRIV
ncbi:DNA-binding transcriptional regulator, Lrp family [Arthrobacter sp. yr096]|uniref:Lrp/AsnC family transcriptional regulator n=1 Tax=Arthrobacter sp. yr096 TaxID=1761750 RepID=UPI0008B88F4F|nr:Lrp/AsnC family transcriptional regulator [Arthrobacter sp. yr096]SEJ05641.1 DNA-binding transcriptional regulator, Lrp family [Arthrobacter sp. yr096]